MSLALVRVKNALQEYAQQNGYELPTYSTVEVPSDNITPCWKTTVRVLGKEYEGPTCMNKKGATALAAAYALKDIRQEWPLRANEHILAKPIETVYFEGAPPTGSPRTSREVPARYDPTQYTDAKKVNKELYVPEDVIILVDMENVPVKFSGKQVIRYASRGHSQEKNSDIVVNSVLSNAVDTRIIVDATLYALTEDYYVYIVSKDKFAAVTAEIIKQQNGFAEQLFNEDEVYAKWPQ